MLFSDKSIANFITQYFEPAWQSLREVPKVTIDFGNGKIIKRTLKGNIATFVCMPDGNTIDVLPGIYAPNTYAFELKKIRDFAKVLSAPSLAKNYKKTLLAYHQSRLASLKQAPISNPTITPSSKAPRSLKTLSNWEALKRDTLFNESTRRAQIHEFLKDKVLKPESMTKWLYKEVLHADLDDPYMGLGDKLFENYPFRR